MEPHQDQSRGADAGVWRSVWRRGVCSNPRASLLVELPSTLILEASRSAVELLELDGRDDVKLTDICIAPSGALASSPADLLANGALETIHGLFRFRRPESADVHAWCWARAVRSPAGPDLCLVGLHPADAGGGPATVANMPAVQVLAGDVPPGQQLATWRLDDCWRVESAVYASDTSKRDPSAPLGAFALDLVEPADRTDVLCAFGLASTGVRVIIRVRLTGTGSESTEPVLVVVAFDRGRPRRYVLDLYPFRDPEAVRYAARVADLEQRLRRIAGEIQGTDVGVAMWHAGPFNTTMLEGLSGRQIEIVSRLLRGQRVPEIAAQVYVSKSTVRNHLAAVFRKLGVHSQAELIDLMRENETARES